jgi:hypothetical protein
MRVSAQIEDAAQATPAPRRDSYAPPAVDNTDWLKTAAIILVSIDHFGHYFVNDDRWWSVVGRLAAPTFFFLIGFAHTRAVPHYWIWLGVILTLLNSWNANWNWVAPNILLSLALIRFARPHVQALLQRFGWVAFVVVVCALVALLPVATMVVDYGAEGWLWGLFGLCQRMYVDGKSVNDTDRAAGSSAAPVIDSARLMGLIAGLVAAVAYVWQEQQEYAFRQVHFIAFVIGVGVLALALYLFRRGASRIQPPEAIAATLRFIGRHTLEIYAIQLAASELLVKFVPSLAP